MPDTSILHATCIAINDRGVLLLGDSGNGKSDLALRLIDSGASLVADDQVSITRNDRYVVASAPERLRGLLEIRGAGIWQLPYNGATILKFAFQLVPREHVERFPEPVFFNCLGLRLPLWSLHAFDASTPAKIRLLVQQQE